MPQTHIICPDNHREPLEACMQSCRLASQYPCGRCTPKPLLVAMFGKPRAIVPGHYSTTTLTAPTRLSYLLRTTDYAESPEDAYFRVYGTAIHSVLGDDIDGHLNEVRLSEEGDADLAGGQFDDYNGDLEILSDLKVVGAYAVEKVMKAGSVTSGEKLEWALQINRYRQKLERVGLGVKGMAIAMVVRDYNYQHRRKGWGHLLQIRVNRISDRWLDRYFRAKQQRLDSAHETGYCPPCKPDERWGGNRCRSYCPVVDACRDMSERANEPHPVFGWIGG